MSARPGSDAFVAVGRVLKPRGLQGEAFLAPLTDFHERFQDLDEVLVQMPDGTRRPLRIGLIRAYGNRFGVKFLGVDSIEAVSRFRGGLLLIPREAVHPLPEDTFYVFEIVGLAVETEAGETVGRVVDVLSLPGNDVYVVDRAGQEVLVPAVRDFVHVDLEAGRIVVRDLDGLI